MMRLIFLMFLLMVLNAGPGRAEGVDLSSPQTTYETCYSRVNFLSDKKDIRRKASRCLTRTAQKAALSYMVLGAHFIDSIKDLHGQNKYPHFLGQVNVILGRYELLGGSRLAFQKADLAAALGDLLPLYATNPFITEMLHYSKRELKDLEQQDKSARAADLFKFKTPLPTNRLELRFIKVDDKWLINHISHRP